MTPPSSRLSARYRHVGRLYDVVSLERLVYRRPRRRLIELLGPLPGATAVDVGCGTGLNTAGLRSLVGPAGRVIGIDRSHSMLDAARRRAQRAGWTDVSFVEGDAADLPDAVDAVVATFVLSLLDDDEPFWRAVERLATRRPVRVGVADLGRPVDAAVPLRTFYDVLTGMGGGDPDRRPWQRLAAAGDAHHEVHHGGHVHLAVGTFGGTGR